MQQKNAKSELQRTIVGTGGGEASTGATAADSTPAGTGCGRGEPPLCLQVQGSSFTTPAVTVEGGVRSGHTGSPADARTLTIKMNTRQAMLHPLLLTCEQEVKRGPQAPHIQRLSHHDSLLVAAKHSKGEAVIRKRTSP